MPVKIKDFNLPDENVQYDINFIRKNLSLLLEHDIENKKCVVGITEKTSDEAKKISASFIKMIFRKLNLLQLKKRNFFHGWKIFQTVKMKKLLKKLVLQQAYHLDL